MKKKQTPAAEGNRIRSRLITVFKLIFVVALLGFLVKNGFISPQAMLQAAHQWPKLLPAVLGLFLTMVMGVFRWQWLLKAQNIHLSWYRTFQLTLIGNFFNIALPGAVSGDFVKAFYIGQEMKGHRSRAFGSILFDRVAGLSALVMVSATALFFQIKRYAHTPLLGAIGWLLTVAALCVVLFYGYLFLVREKHDIVLILLRKAEKKVPVLGSLVRVYESLRHYHNHRWTIMKVLLISCLIHLTVGWCCLTFAQALDSTPLSLFAVYIIVPLGLLVTAVPVAPAGVGTGNVAFLYLFDKIGSARGADIYSLYALTNILIGCLGAVIYFRFKSSRKGAASMKF
jgi:uncharacterized protein (TIRG00374 family)